MSQRHAFRIPSPSRLLSSRIYTANNFIAPLVVNKSTWNGQGLPLIPRRRRLHRSTLREPTRNGALHQGPGQIGVTSGSVRKEHTALYLVRCAKHTHPTTFSQTKSKSVTVQSFRVHAVVIYQVIPDSTRIYPTTRTRLSIPHLIRRHHRRRRRPGPTTRTTQTDIFFSRQSERAQACSRA